MSHTPKEVPMLFSTEMVRAILDGTKTMTRRLMKPQPRHIMEIGLDKTMPIEKFNRLLKSEANHGRTQLYTEGALSGFTGPKAACEVGDVIWVREAFGVDTWNVGLEVEIDDIIFKADGNPSPTTKWKPSIYLKKEDARIWLRCTEVKAERLIEITPEDALREGIQRLGDDGEEAYRIYGIGLGLWTSKPISSFLSLFDSINGTTDLMKWVWVYGFEVLSVNGRPENI